MFGDALSYPTEGESITPIIIGAVLSIFSIFILPAILLYGYLLTVLETSIDGQDVPPEFNDWGDYLVKGIVGIVISFVYFLIPTVVFLVILFVFGGGGALLGGEAGVASLLGGLLIAGLASSVLFLAASYIMPAALGNYVRTGSVGAAFSFGTIKDICMNGNYLKGWLVAVVIVFVGNFVAGFVSGVLGIIPILGLLLGPIVASPIAVYTGMASQNAYGRGIRQSI